MQLHPMVSVEIPMGLKRELTLRRVEQARLDRTSSKSLQRLRPSSIGTDKEGQS